MPYEFATGVELVEASLNFFESEARGRENVLAGLHHLVQVAHGG